MTSPIMVQVDLEHPIDKIPTHKAGMTTWVENNKGVKRGSIITLKEFGDMEWRVVKVYDIEVPKDQLDMNRNWDNNDYNKHISTPIKERK